MQCFDNIRKEMDQIAKFPLGTNDFSLTGNWADEWEHKIEIQNVQPGFIYFTHNNHKWTNKTPLKAYPFITAVVYSCKQMNENIADAGGVKVCDSVSNMKHNIYLFQVHAGQVSQSVFAARKSPGNNSQEIKM